MEGGVYPWKRQRPELDGVVYADYAQILKPLPPPPDGLTWVKRRVEEDVFVQEEGEQGEAGVVRAARFVWELVEKPVRPGQEEAAEEPLVELEDDDQLPDFIEHTVLATDTMAGLRLRYKITPAELRKHNDFAGENFHMLPTLQIPIQGREDHIKKHKQRPTKEVLRQRFSNATRCTDFQMQTYYLEANDWDLAAAVRECEEDRKWEEEHGAHQQMTRVPVIEGDPPADASNTNISLPVQHQPVQEPPPSYTSFFKVKIRRGANNRPSHYYPWPINAATSASSSSSSSSAASLLRRPSARGTYDMAPMLMEDFAAAGDTTIREEEGGLGGDYVRIEGDGAGQGAVSVPVAVAVVAPRHGSRSNHDEKVEDSHEAALRAPLLGGSE